MKGVSWVYWFGTVVVLATIAFSVWQIRVQRERAVALQTLMTASKRQEALLQKYPGDRDVIINLARLYRAEGKTQAADQYFNRAAQLDPNNPEL